MKLTKILFVSACATLAVLPEVSALTKEEAINKNLWLNTNGHLGALPGQKPKNPDAQPTRYKYDSSIWDEFDTSDSQADFSRSWKWSLGIEWYGASALEDLSESIEGADLFGSNLKFSVRKSGSAVSPEFYLLCGCAIGESDSSASGNVYDVVFAEFSAGTNLRWQICDSLALSVGGRIGLGILSVSDGIEYYGQEDEEVKAGLVYGGRAELEWNFNANHALTLACDYLACTAQPKNWEGYSNGWVEVEKQSWIMISLGYKYTF